MKYFVFFFLIFISLPSAQAQELTPTRQLRRLYLSLTNTEPPVEKYQDIIDAADPDQYLADESDRLLSSTAFQDALTDWGHAYIPIPAFTRKNPVWRSSLGIHADLCASGTLHEGAIGIFAHQGDPGTICDDPNIVKKTVTPWWDPSITMDVIGVASNADQQFNGEDCGIALVGLNWVKPKTIGCGCGPNLIYCKRFFLGHRFATGYGSVTRLDGNDFEPNSQKRSLHEEPAKFLAYLIMNDRPFSDLILSNYTIVDRGLYQVYTRIGRQSGLAPERDNNPWFNQFSSNDEWIEVKFSDLHPHLLDDPDYRYDPLVQDSEPLGIPASGVLTMLGPNSAWPRPRVRAARWLESVGCDAFSPPETPITFTPYKRDPGKEGMCIQCHTRLDPAAISFKRIYDSGRIAGLGNWKINDKKFSNRMISDTVMTPISQADIDADPNNRLYDFLPPGQLLLGQQGDGTIGPRGFAKVLIKSGAFDTCAVKRAYQRFAGISLNVANDQDELADAVETFVNDNRNMKNLIKKIVLNSTRGY